MYRMMLCGFPLIFPFQNLKNPKNLKRILKLSGFSSLFFLSIFFSMIFSHIIPRSSLNNFLHPFQILPSQLGNSWNAQSRNL